MPVPRAKANWALSDVDADAAMLHVEEDEIGAGIGGDLAKPGREELGREHAVDGLALAELGAERIGADRRAHAARSLGAATPSDCGGRDDLRPALRVDAGCRSPSARAGCGARSRRGGAPRRRARAAATPWSTPSAARDRRAKKSSPPKAAGSMTTDSHVVDQASGGRRRGMAAEAAGQRAGEDLAEQRQARALVAAEGEDRAGRIGVERLRIGGRAARRRREPGRARASRACCAPPGSCPRRRPTWRCRG